MSTSFNDTETRQRIDEKEHEKQRDTHDFSGGRSDEIPPRERANFGCPQCDRELVPGPWNSWICWVCGDVIYVEGGDRR